MATAEAPTLSGFEELAPPLSRDEALLEADRCLECGGARAPAPCVLACPADVDVPSFVASIAADEPEAAAATIFRANLLGGTCARVCPVEELCAGACVLPHEGMGPIAIGRLQRYACDLALERGAPLRERLPYNWHDVAVIGGGPAGLACAGELGALGYHVTVFDERAEPGGLVRYAIAPYRQLRDPLPTEARLLADLGVSFELGLELGSSDGAAGTERGLRRHRARLRNGGRRRWAACPATTSRACGARSPSSKRSRPASRPRSGAAWR